MASETTTQSPTTTSFTTCREAAAAYPYDGLTRMTQLGLASQEQIIRALLHRATEVNPEHNAFERTFSEGMEDFLPAFVSEFHVMKECVPSSTPVEEKTEEVAEEAAEMTRQQEESVYNRVFQSPATVLNSEEDAVHLPLGDKNMKIEHLVNHLKALVTYSCRLVFAGKSVVSLRGKANARLRTGETSPWLTEFGRHLCTYAQTCNDLDSLVGDVVVASKLAAEEEKARKRVEYASKNPRPSHYHRPNGHKRYNNQHRCPVHKVVASYVDRDMSWRRKGTPAGTPPSSPTNSFRKHSVPKSHRPHHNGSDYKRHPGRRYRVSQSSNFPNSFRDGHHQTEVTLQMPDGSFQRALLQ